METKGLILLAILAMVFASVDSQEDDFLVEVLSPRGFRVSIENFPGIQRVGFRGNINTELLRHETAEYTGDFALHSNDWWVYENPSVLLNPGDTLFYRPQILSRTSGVLNFAQQFHVPDDIPSQSTSDLYDEAVEDPTLRAEDEIASPGRETEGAQQFYGPDDIPSNFTPDADEVLDEVIEEHENQML